MQARCFMSLRVLLAHPGTQHSAQLARQLEARGVLGEFWTGIGFATDGGAGANAAAVLRRLPGLGGLASRVVSGVPGERLRTVPLNELRALWRLRRPNRTLAVIHERNAGFQRAIPDISIEESDAVIGFDTSSWLLARRSVAWGRPFYLERTIGHPQSLQALVRRVQSQYPDWADTAPARPEPVVAAERVEHDIAHRIVVGSGFVAETLIENGVDPARIRVNPYGVDWARFAAGPPARQGRPLRFLFAGSLLARKGLPVLLEGWRKLAPRDAELWLVGRAGPRERRLIPELPELRMVGPVPGAGMAGIYAKCDVLVLPTYFEGFSLTLLEAVAAGLPVIATPNSGAPQSLLEPPLGRGIETGSVDALVAAMRHYIDHPPNRAEIRAAAVPLRAEYSWEAYGERWTGLLRES